MNTTALENREIARQHSNEVKKGERFEFGRNWSRFLELLNEERILKAEESLSGMLETDTLDGLRFLDIGSGSGLFSLAAKRLGAKVHSFDFDTSSYECTRELKRRFFKNDEDWVVEQGSALDRKYIESLGKFDIVYSWGVLHHTGAMWDGLDNASLAVGNEGLLFVAIYNDTGSQAKRWKVIKKTYCQLPTVLKTPFAILTMIPEETRRMASAIARLKPWEYFEFWKNYTNSRGMNYWYDIIDWVGGYPYEVAAPDEIFEFYKEKGFELRKLKCGGVGLGCNEFVFRKRS